MRDAARLSSSSPLFQRKGYAIEKIQYRRRTRTRMGQSRSPVLRGVMHERRLAVVLSREDLTAGLVGYPSSTVDGYEPESAYRIMRNIILSRR